MIEVKDATKCVLENLFSPQTEVISWDESVGRMLDEDIMADRDFPPFDRVMMDGIAIRKSDFDQGIRTFNIIGLQPAGSPPLTLDTGSACLEIMTGAVLAKVADSVIRYEDVEIHDGKATVLLDEVRRMQNIHLQGSDRTQGSCVITRGRKIGEGELAVLASVGKTQVKVKTAPQVIIVSTGDELVDVGHLPLRHQIRKSNVHMLDSMCKAHGLKTQLLHVPDEESALEKRLDEVIKDADVVLLSGGVSKGKLDFIPGILEKIGVQKLFHRVKQRPGKPFWFGKTEHTTIFAFPGNPVSTFMCAQRYFLPWLEESMGTSSIEPCALLSEDFTFKPKLTYFLQCKVHLDKSGKLWATPHAGQGSGDLANLTESDAFLELPAETTNFEKGQAFRLWPFRTLF